MQPNIEDRIRFEKLLSNISARFINISIDQIDPSIEQALFEILTFFQTDRIGLIRIFPENDVFMVTHLACAPGIPGFPTSVELPANMFPYTFKKIVKEHVIVSYASLDELPDEANIDKETQQTFGTQSVLHIPIEKKTPSNYSISINSVTRKRQWPEVYFSRLQLLGEIFVNVLELKKTRIHLHARLEFEEMLSSISALFINLSPDHLDDAIQSVLDRLVRFLDLDRIIVARFSNCNSRSIATHFSTSHGTATSWKELENRDLPWLFNKLHNQEVVQFYQLDELPDEAEREKAFFSLIRVKSCVVIPLIANGYVHGFLGCSTLYAQKEWPKETIQGLRLVAHIFANSMARKRSDELLRESEERYRTVLDYTLDWEYWLNPDGTIQYMSPSCEPITGYPVREFMDNPEKVKEIIVSEDRHFWDAHFHDPSMLSEVSRIEFRICRQDGEIRWLEHICRPMIDSEKNFLGIRASSRDISQRKNLELHLQDNFQEINRLRQLLEEENLFLRQEIQLQHVHEEIVGSSDAMKQVLSQVEQVAATDSTVLILGETGTGKELLAKAIHQLSRFKDRPLVTVNCACLPPTLMESELFGREKGAYTGALTRMVGRFEVADGSSLFLDEIGELPLDIQSKLLRVLEEGRFERLGSSRTIQVQVRIIAATNRDLEKEVKDGLFRKDLYYRLNVFPIHIPPLRNRPEDIPLLVWSMVKQLEQKIGKRINTISRKTMETLQRYDWPGNVRELRNVIEHAMILSKGSTLTVLLPNHAEFSTNPDNCSLNDLERRHIMDVLGKTGWRISGSGGAAEILNMKRTTLQSRIKKLGIRRPGT